MQVRDYELDQYGVVNNACYASYLQHARHEALAALGVNADTYARQGNALALAKLSMQFRAPLRSQDHFTVQVWVAQLTAARVVMGQAIVKPQPHAEAVQATLALGDGALPAAPAEGTVRPQVDVTPTRGWSDGGAGGAPAGAVAVLSAEAEVVWLDGRYRPVRVPKDVAAVLAALMRTDA